MVIQQTLAVPIIGLGSALALLWKRWRHSGSTRQRAKWLEGFPDAVLMTDKKGYLHYANPQAEALFGYGRGELAGQGVWQLFPDNANTKGRVWARLFFHRDVNRTVGNLGLCKGRHRDGSILSLIVNACAFPDDQLVMLLPRRANTWDSAHPTLHLAAELLEPETTETGVGTWILHRNSRRLSWSDEVHAIFATDPRSFHPTHERLLAHIHSEDREMLLSQLELGMGSSQPFDLDFRILRSCGEQRHVLARCHTHFTLAGKVDHVWGTILDITGLKQLQQKLRQSQIVVEHCSEGIIIADKDGKWTFVNPALCRMTGCSAATLLASPPVFHTANQQPLDLEQLQRTLDDDRHWQGELNLPRCDGGMLPVLASLVQVDDTGQHVWVLSDITLLLRYQAQLHDMAYHDPLTGLANRTFFGEQLNRLLGRAGGERTGLAVAFIDLNGFKQVNDILGHAEGDRLLKKIGQSLKTALRDSDVVARWGGDEFAVLLPDCSGTDNARKRVSRLREHVRQEWTYPGGSLRVTASIGVAISPQHGDDAQTLMQNADQAMYRAKFYGEDVICFFTEDIPISPLMQ
ncbi:diguanylate cyclase domain-containing protein [Paludibacterium yongneupense]|uniref:diguanylate cyclase domain-containing protein n=1 Tax=Paludibacterium yongneupense TaxID=400061 RepID=UPI0003FFDFE7|nr:diguanylate cyclase [Paludibacterium yongneupense]